MVEERKKQVLSTPSPSSRWLGKTVVKSERIDYWIDRIADPQLRLRKLNLTETKERSERGTHLRH